MTKMMRGALRETRRLGVFQPAQIRRGDAGDDIHVLDVSRTAVLAHSDDPPEYGTACSLVLCGQEYHAHVAWVRRKQFGLRFAEPLTGEDIGTFIDGRTKLIEEGRRKILCPA
ncbi:hypothetical protein [Stakelama marina]|uniref:PilZ domain-containing protein n=1 Tax=Stakelama marina TaxID=2826939 RepID=A0A8T4I982_9SPHN|nr:hypothetical protein [Stakelama marina]MBR0551207.1 hypothetical protein [Stakelama marina]